jgi:hypothetical protein
MTRLLLQTLISIAACQLVLPGCFAPALDTQQTPPPISAATPRPQITPTLTVEQVLLAKDGANGKLEPVEEDIFVLGERVNMVLVNVRGFKKGSDGKNKFDMDIQVKDGNGKIILSQSQLLGTQGHQDLPGNIARSPYGIFNTTSKLGPGDYTITLSLYDLVGKGVVTKSKVVTLN